MSPFSIFDGLLPLERTKRLSGELLFLTRRFGLIPAITCVLLGLNFVFFELLLVSRFGLLPREPGGVGFPPFDTIIVCFCLFLECPY